MKIRHLHEIELARIAPMPQDIRISRLRQIRDSWPPFTYNPLRSCLQDIFNVQHEMLGPLPKTDPSLIDKKLRRACWSEDQLSANLAVSKGLLEFTAKRKIAGRKQEFLPMALARGWKVTYWLPLVLSIEDEVLIPFIDPRTTRCLDQEGRRFVFSVMHERIRAANLDYADVQFAVMQFGDDDDGIRHLHMHTDADVELFTLDELNSMVSATYDLWGEISEERRAAAYRKAAGMRGPLI